MTLKIRDAGTLRTIKRLTVRIGGVNRRIKTIKGMDGGTLRLLATLADDLAVSAPSSTTGFGDGTIGDSITTEPVSATVTGGIGPFSYAWVRQSNEGIASTATAPSKATTSFKKSGNPVGSTRTDVWRVTVTDSTGTTATTDVSAIFSNNGLG